MRKRALDQRDGSAGSHLPAVLGILLRVGTDTAGEDVRQCDRSVSVVVWAQLERAELRGLDGSRERRGMNRTVDGDCVVCSKLRHRFSDVSALLVSMSDREAE